ncbi:fumarylacetoacetate hydrolase family protein [Arthrobacter sp. NPDC089319]|uniref:fumarylacetoacetate hydrolase family protein n=1 Tax=Arthrobacter sp. NPDC089319 TaxID=3155915 RepID=UPI00341B8A5C
MKYINYIHEGRTACGVVIGDTVHRVDWNMRDLMVLSAAGQEREVGLQRGPGIDLGAVTTLPPVLPESRIICAGINYVEHQIESADVFSANIPENPILFMKDEAAMCGPYDVLELPADVSEEFDWEAEMGVVIGAPARGVDRAEAWDVVAGFTVVNDITARDLQTKHQQWTLGKNVERSTPIGPWIVSRDEIGSEPDLELQLRVNGAVKQSARTKDMIFDIPTLISVVSNVIPLRPGDILVTGTPAGVGFKRNPAEFLRDGDVVETSIESVGTLRNPVRVTRTAPLVASNTPA